jgi:hypothetical protein
MKNIKNSISLNIQKQIKKENIRFQFSNIPIEEF